jgi:hypothetical protein
MDRSLRLALLGMFHETNTFALERNDTTGVPFVQGDEVVGIRTRVATSGALQRRPARPAWSSLASAMLTSYAAAEEDMDVQADLEARGWLWRAWMHAR